MNNNNNNDNNNINNSNIYIYTYMIYIYIYTHTYTYIYIHTPIPTPTPTAYLLRDRNERRRGPKGRLAKGRQLQARPEIVTGRCPRTWFKTAKRIAPRCSVQIYIYIYIYNVYYY